MSVSCGSIWVANCNRDTRWRGLKSLGRSIGGMGFAMQVTRRKKNGRSSPRICRRNSAAADPGRRELRAVVNAVFYIAQTACQWRLLPKDFPPFTTVQGYFYRWRDEGRWRAINHDLVMRAREAIGREASPTAGAIDSQSVKTCEAGGPRGFDAGKKVKGRKRHIATDTEGHLLGVQVHAADIQDRDGAVGVIASLRRLYPWLRHLFADSGYA